MIKQICRRFASIAAKQSQSTLGKLLDNPRANALSLSKILLNISSQEFQNKTLDLENENVGKLLEFMKTFYPEKLTASLCKYLSSQLRIKELDYDMKIAVLATLADKGVVRNELMNEILNVLNCSSKIKLDSYKNCYNIVLLYAYYNKGKIKISPTKLVHDAITRLMSSYIPLVDFCVILTLPEELLVQYKRLVKLHLAYHVKTATSFRGLKRLVENPLYLKKGQDAFLSSAVSLLKTISTSDSFTEVASLIDLLCNIYDISPEVVQNHVSKNEGLFIEITRILAGQNAPLIYTVRLACIVNSSVSLPIHLLSEIRQSTEGLYNIDQTYVRRLMEILMNHASKEKDTTERIEPFISFVLREYLSAPVLTNESKETLAKWTKTEAICKYLSKNGEEIVHLEDN